VSEYLSDASHCKGIENPAEVKTMVDSAIEDVVRFAMRAGEGLKDPCGSHAVEEERPRWTQRWHLASPDKVDATLKADDEGLYSAHITRDHLEGFGGLDTTVDWSLKSGEVRLTVSQKDWDCNHDAEEMVGYTTRVACTYNPATGTITDLTREYILPTTEEVDCLKERFYQEMLLRDYPID